AEVVRQQAEAGVDIPSDGEFGKVGWTSYVSERLAGLEPGKVQAGAGEIARQIFGKDRQDFAEFYDLWGAHERTMWLPPAIARQPSPPSMIRWECTGPISYKGQSAIQADIANFKAALAGVPVEDAFLPVSA